MNDNEINIAIAEACGWKYSEKFDHWEKDGQVAFCDGNSLHYRQLPSYTADLNAMHEAEKVLTAEQFQDYDSELTDQYVLHQSNNPIHATARQRAEAFLRTSGKWKE